MREGGGVRGGGVRSEGVRSEGVRRREDGSVAGSRAARERSSRFPEILTLPALVGEHNISYVHAHQDAKPLEEPCTTSIHT